MNDANGIVWEDPPEVLRANSKGNEKHRAFFHALRVNPGRWAIVPTIYSGSSSASAIKNFKKTYGPGYEYTARKQDDGTARLYVRYVGDAS